MKVCMLAFRHSTQDTRVFYREALPLQRAGHIVCVIGCGRQRTFLRTRRVDDVLLHEVPPPHPSLWWRALLDPFYWLWLLVVSVIKGCKSDVFHCHEYQSLLVGFLVAKLYRAHLVYDCHEYQPESVGYIIAKCIPGLFERTCRSFRAFERFCNRYVTAAITAHPGVAKRFQEDGCRRVVYLPNYPSLSMPKSPAAPPAHWRDRLRDKYVILYVGYLSKERGALQMVDMLGCMAEQQPNAVLFFVGPVSEQLKKEMVALGARMGIAERLCFAGGFQPKDLMGFLSLGTIGIYLIQPEPVYHLWCEGTKFFQYAAAGLPVVVSDVPAYRRLVEKYRNGVLVPHNDPRKAVDAVGELLRQTDRMQELGHNGRRAFESELNAEAVVVRLIQLYHDLEPRLSKI